MHFFACTRYWSPTPCPHIPAQKRYSWVMAFRRTVKVNVVQDPWARHSQPPVGKGEPEEQKERGPPSRRPLPSAVCRRRGASWRRPVVGAKVEEWGEAGGEGWRVARRSGNCFHRRRAGPSRPPAQAATEGAGEGRHRPSLSPPNPAL
jgi:hypothetical protein